MDNPLPDYFLLLRQAFGSHEDADTFDVHSEDPVSHAAWELLCRSENASQIDLINYVYANYDALKEAFNRGRREGHPTR